MNAVEICFRNVDKKKPAVEDDPSSNDDFLEMVRCTVQRMDDS